MAVASTNQVIIDISLTNADYIKAAEETLKKMDDLKKRQKELKDAGKESSVQYTANAQSLAGLKKELQSYTQLTVNAANADKALAAAGKNSDTVYKDETGSINELRARLALLTAQRNAMTEADRDGTKAGKELTEQTKELNERLKELEKQVGDTRRNVGNYNEAITDAIAGQVPFGGEIIKSVQGLKAFSAATMEGGSALNIFKLALASTGIGLIILALAALINYLKNLKPLMEAIQKITAGMKAAFDVLGRIVFEVGEKMYKALSKPYELLKDITNFLAHPIDGFRKLGEAASEAGREMEASFKAAAKLEEQKIKAEANDIQAISTTAKLRMEKERLLALSKDYRLSEEQRQKLNNEAQSKELAAVKIEKDNAVTRLANLKEEEAQFKKNNKAKEAGDDLLRKIAEAQAQVYDFESRAWNVQQERFEEEKDRIDKQEADEAAAAAKRQQLLIKRLDANKQLDQSTLKTTEIGRSARLNEIAQMELEIKEKKIKYRDYADTVAKLEEERLARLGLLNKKYGDEDLKQANADADKLAELEASRFLKGEEQDKARAMIKNARAVADQDKVISDVNERITQGEAGLTEILATQQKIRLQLLNQQQYEEDQITVQYAEERRQREGEIKQKSIEDEQARVAAVTAIREAEYKMQDDAFMAFSNLVDRQSDLGKAMLVMEKAIAIARIVIKAQEAKAADLLAEKMENAWLGGVPFAGLGLVAANMVKHQADRARITAQAIISTALVASTAVAGFADGVIGFNSDGQGSMVRGAGTGRSDSINARLSNGESVINARSTSMFGGLLSAINTAGGGRPLDGAYTGNAFAMGGLITDGIGLGRQVSEEIATTNSIAQAMKNVVIVTQVRDVTRAQADVATARIATSI